MALRLTLRLTLTLTLTLTLVPTLTLILNLTPTRRCPAAPGELLGTRPSTYMPCTKEAKPFSPKSRTALC